ncbi:MAG: molybdopterin-guanine dinucleotide biosynthesis protein B [Alphaproteobacteria bacterium]|nr:MAG: molybdopterin-guanine dinucleotide biosynthesis protein B [Alphaproteobacteria bacterium]
MSRPVFGIVGWKNSGKTTLVARLVEEFTRRGYSVSAVKHAHHSFDIDHPGRDSYRFREAGARQVALVSPKRWALMHELRGEAKPELEAVLEHVGPCDLVLVEGFKGSAIPKIEARSTRSLTQEPLCDNDPNIVAVASDTAIASGALPAFDVNDIEGIADFIADTLGLEKK